MTKNINKLAKHLQTNSITTLELLIKFILSLTVLLTHTVMFILQCVFFPFHWLVTAIKKFSDKHGRLFIGDI